MKTNILSKFAFICLLLISFGCSKESTNEMEEVTQSKVNYSTSFEESLKSNETNKGATNLNPVVNKYLKVVYATESGRGILRNIFNNTTTAPSSVTEMTSEDNLTDLWIFREIDQPVVDAIFITPPDINCIACSYLLNTPGENNPDYIDVNQVCYEQGTTESQKNFLRGTSNGLMHIISNLTNCEIWVMRSCCLSQEDDLSGTIQPINFTYTITTIQ